MNKRTIEYLPALCVPPAAEATNRPRLLTRLRWLAPLLLLATSACTVRFISEHDPVLDEATSGLQAQLEAFLNGMESKAGALEGTYDSNRDFYDSVRAELSTLRLRAEAQPKSELLVRHYELLGQNVDQLVKLHQEGAEAGLKPAVIGPAREAFRTQFRALLTLHAALRRGA